MDKSILAIDKPANCDECDICYYKDKELFCPFVGFLVDKDYTEIIHDDCPLKSMPVKQPCNYYDFENYTNGYSKGWNDCVDYLNEEGRWEKKQEKKDGTT